MARDREILTIKIASKIWKRNITIDMLDKSNIDSTLLSK